MYIIDRQRNENRTVYVSNVVDGDFKQITKKRYLFNWKKLQDECTIYKLALAESDDILGLIALTEHPDEERTEIKLLTVSVENIGKEKQYDRIAGCLIAFAAKEALKKYKDFPCVSLIPKTEIRQHYIYKYQMTDTGWQLYLEGILLMNMIKEYLP
jgi:hypothetical protein